LGEKINSKELSNWHKVQFGVLRQHCYNNYAEKTPKVQHQARTYEMESSEGGSTHLGTEDGGSTSVSLAYFSLESKFLVMVVL